MASSIEDILMAKAMADAEKRPDPAVAMGGGAAVGGVLGALPGIGGARGRMAGGLIGAITRWSTRCRYTSNDVCTDHHLLQICLPRCKHRRRHQSNGSACN